MSIATINQCINLRNRHNNGSDGLMPRAIFVQQHGLAKSKSDISDSILLSFACNSQPFTFLSCDRGRNESTFQHNWNRKHFLPQPPLLFWSVSQMLSTHYVDGIAFFLLVTRWFQMPPQMFYMVFIPFQALSVEDFLQKQETT